MDMEGVVHVTTNATTWGVVAEDGTLYTTLALLAAAGKSAWPNLTDGEHPESIELSCENGSGAAGAAFYFARNKGAAFSSLANEGLRDNQGDLLYGSGQKESIPGVNFRLGTFVPTYNIWVRKTTGGDEVILKAVRG